MKPHRITQINFVERGAKSKPIVVWGHGWGQSHKAFLEIATSLSPLARHILIDFPGFGDTSAPPDAWGTEEYAKTTADFIQGISGGERVIWVGHSFGCRVGIQMAAKYPDLFAGLFLIAAAGLRPKRSLLKSIHIKMKILTFKILKRILPTQTLEAWMKRKFGSKDYASASPIMRRILVKVVNEDLSPQAVQIHCPVTLVYGAEDFETPLEIGQRLHRLIPGSSIVSLPEQNHYSVLAEGRHLVAPLLKRFIDTHAAPAHDPT